MLDFPSPGSRLHALIGSAIHRLPPHLVHTLELHLAEPPQAYDAATPVLHSPLRHYAASADAAGETRASSRTLRERAAIAGRKLRGIAAILEILQAEHSNRHDGAGEPLLGAHLMDGLLVAARDLLDSAEEVLEPV